MGILCKSEALQAGFNAGSMHAAPCCDLSWCRHDGHSRGVLIVSQNHRNAAGNWESSVVMQREQEAGLDCRLHPCLQHASVDTWCQQRTAPGCLLSVLDSRQLIVCTRALQDCISSRSSLFQCSSGLCACAAHLKHLMTSMHWQIPMPTPALHRPCRSAPTACWSCWSVNGQQA